MQIRLLVPISFRKNLVFTAYSIEKLSKIAQKSSTKGEQLLFQIVCKSYFGSHQSVSMTNLTLGEQRQDEYEK